MRPLRRWVDAVDRVRPFVRDADLDGVDLPLDLLADATVTEPSAGRAHFAVEWSRNLFEQYAADAEYVTLFRPPARVPRVGTFRS